MKVKSLSHVQLFGTPWTVANQAPLSMGFSRQGYWSGLSFPSPMHESGKWKLKAKSLSRVGLFATPWTATHQAPLSMGFSRQESWSGVPLPSPVEENMVIHKQHKLTEKVKDELVTISEWLKWGYTHHKIVYKQNFVHSIEYDKSRTFKEVVQRI